MNDSFHAWTVAEWILDCVIMTVLNSQRVLVETENLTTCLGLSVDFSRNHSRKEKCEYVMANVNLVNWGRCAGEQEKIPNNA